MSEPAAKRPRFDNQGTNNSSNNAEDGIAPPQVQNDTSSPPSSSAVQTKTTTASTTTTTTTTAAATSAATTLASTSSAAASSDVVAAAGQTRATRHFVGGLPAFTTAGGTVTTTSSAPEAVAAPNLQALHQGPINAPMTNRPFETLQSYVDASSSISGLPASLVSVISAAQASLLASAASPASAAKAMAGFATPTAGTPASARKVRRTPRRKLSYKVPDEDLALFPRQVLANYLSDSKSLYEDTVVQAERVWKLWREAQASEEKKPRLLPEDLCDYGPGRVKDFREAIRAADVGMEAFRYLQEERERNMNRKQKRDSRDRIERRMSAGTAAHLKKPLGKGEKAVVGAGGVPVIVLSRQANKDDPDAASQQAEGSSQLPKPAGKKGKAATVNDKNAEKADAAKSSEPVSSTPVTASTDADPSGPQAAPAPQSSSDVHEEAAPSASAQAQPNEGEGEGRRALRSRKPRK